MAHPRRAAQGGGQEPRGAPAGAPEPVRVELLGGFRISVGARTIEEGEWRLKKAANLIELLALTPDHRLHREQAMDLLWPELGPGPAANNLRYALHVARRTLEPAPAVPSRHLQLHGSWLALCPDGPLWIDVEAFEEAAATAQHARDPAAYRAAIDLYAGDLLPHNRYEAWAEDRREGLRRSYLMLLVELAGLYEEREDFAPAIEALSRVVASDPAYEEAHVGLIRMYAASGKRHEAILQYEQLRSVLSAEEPRTTAPMPEQPSAGRATGRLTRRQKEIALLVARGLTNRQIAAELGISEYTATTHVRNTFKNLGLHSRVQLTAWVMEQGLLL